MISFKLLNPNWVLILPEPYLLNTEVKQNSSSKCLISAGRCSIPLEDLRPTSLPPQCLGWPKYPKGGPFLEKIFFWRFLGFYWYQMKDNDQLIPKLFEFFVCVAFYLRYFKKCGEKWQKWPNCPKTPLFDVFSQISQERSITNKKFKQFWNQLIIIFHLIPINP